MGNYIREIFDPPQQIENLTGTQVLTSMVIALICGIIIFAVYRVFNQSVIYSPRFNMLIVLVTIVTALMIITIGTNLVLTLGMVGALSIVRFRAAIKDPLDVGFLFWGIAAGLTAGAQLYAVALLGTEFVAITYIILTLLRFDRHSYLLVVRYTPESDEAVKALLAPLKGRIKSKTSTEQIVELTLETSIRKDDTSFVEKIKETSGVDTVTLVEYTGDYS